MYGLKAAPVREASFSAACGSSPGASICKMAVWYRLLAAALADLSSNPSYQLAAEALASRLGTEDGAAGAAEGEIGKKHGVVADKDLAIGDAAA